jgi:hypothetical protein
MTDLEQHLMARERMKCPTIARAWAGGEAAARLADVKQAKDEALPYYQELIRIWDHAGPNLRAVIAEQFNQASAIMARRWREYDRAVKAEHIVINLERAA